MGDGEAFETFLEEQFTATNTPQMNVATREGTRTFSYVLYRLFRCSLVHEAALVSGGQFVPDATPGRPLLQLTSLDPLAFTMSHSTVIMIADLVARAREYVQQAAAVRHQLMSRLPNWTGP
jgi:hypothetical protein